MYIYSMLDGRRPTAQINQQKLANKTFILFFIVEAHSINLADDG